MLTAVMIRLESGEYNQAMLPEVIRGAISDRVRGCMESVEVTPEIDSTNSELLRRRAVSPGKGVALIAGYQTAGRGRRGRAWIAVPGEVLCLSIGWTFAPPLPELSAMSLAAGICAARALRSLGLPGVALKWPNDLVANDRKLGGILIETRTEPQESVYAVIGIGVNLALQEATRDHIKASGTEPVDVRSLAESSESALPSSALVAAHLIDTLVTGLMEFGAKGFAPFVAEWNAWDSLRMRPVLVQHNHGEARGVARGIDSSGAILVETPRGLERFLSAEVSIRNV